MITAELSNVVYSGRSCVVTAILDPSRVLSAVPALLLRDLGVSTHTRFDGTEVSDAIIFRVGGADTADEATVGGSDVILGMTVLAKLKLVPNPGPDFRPGRAIVTEGVPPDFGTCNRL